jgi:hypothetical protein
MVFIYNKDGLVCQSYSGRYPLMDSLGDYVGADSGGAEKNRSSIHNLYFLFQTVTLKNHHFRVSQKFEFWFEVKACENFNRSNTS